MEPVKVVARYIDGRRVKGFSQDFFPNKDRFHIYSAAKPSTESAEVLIKDLKAVFFVQDFTGNSLYNERKEYIPGDKPSGRKIEVTFKDGEVLVGTTLGYDPNRPGFFLFPVDPKSNNIRIYAVSTAVKKVRYL
ncbi:MAG: hypothetical protein A2026_11785 [Deltaproteobacteria bacterium RBG_19FT_COMBO_46_12]|nr:MAG: hypothetical protein A2026_11785 [Deltaproteobacteria bacterium RBG_19FT_COMBO_46_12]